MVQFNSFDEKMFLCDGITHYRKFFSNVRGNLIRVYNAYNPIDVLTDYTPFTNVSVDGVTFSTPQQLQLALLPVIYNGAVGTGTDFDQNNIFISKQIVYSGDGTPEEFANRVNQLPPFTVGDKQIAVFQAVNPQQPILRAKKYVFVISKIGKGSFGSGNTILTADNIQIMSITQPLESDIIETPTTQFFDLGVIPEGVDISQTVNALNPPINVQGQEDGYVVFKTIIAGNPINYLFLASAGIYGLGNTQTTLDDFLRITDWQQENSGVEEAPDDGFTYGRKNKTWSKVDINPTPPNPNINQVLTVGNTAIDKAQKFESASEPQYKTEQTHKGYKATAGSSSVLIEGQGIELKQGGTKLRVDPYRAVFTKGTTALELNTRDNAAGSFKQEFQAKNGIVALLSDVVGGGSQNIDQTLQIGSVAIDKQMSFRGLDSNQSSESLDIDENEIHTFNSDMSKYATFSKDVIDISKTESRVKFLAQIKPSEIIFGSNNGSITLCRDTQSSGTHVNTLPESTGYLVSSINGTKPDKFGNVVIESGGGDTPTLQQVLTKSPYADENSFIFMGKGYTGDIDNDNLFGLSLGYGQVSSSYEQSGLKTNASLGWNAGSDAVFNYVFSTLYLTYSDNTGKDQVESTIVPNSGTKSTFYHLPKNDTVTVHKINLASSVNGIRADEFGNVVVPIGGGQDLQQTMTNGSHAEKNGGKAYIDLLTDDGENTYIEMLVESPSTAGEYGTIYINKLGASVGSINGDFSSTVDAQNGKLIFKQGDLDGTNETKVVFEDPTGQNTVSIPSKSGTVALLSDINDKTLNDIIKTSPSDNIIEGKKQFSFASHAESAEVISDTSGTYSGGSIRLFSTVENLTTGSTFQVSADLGQRSVEFNIEDIDGDGNEVNSISGIENGFDKGFYLADYHSATNAGNNPDTGVFGNDYLNINTKNGIVFKFLDGQVLGERFAQLKADNIAKGTTNALLQLPNNNGTLVAEINGIKADEFGKITIPTVGGQGLQLPLVSSDSVLSINASDGNITGNVFDKTVLTTSYDNIPSSKAVIDFLNSSTLKAKALGISSLSITKNDLNLTYPSANTGDIFHHADTMKLYIKISRTGWASIPLIDVL